MYKLSAYDIIKCSDLPKCKNFKKQCWECVINCNKIFKNKMFINVKDSTFEKLFKTKYHVDSYNKNFSSHINSQYNHSISAITTKEGDKYFFNSKMIFKNKITQVIYILPTGTTDNIEDVVSYFNLENKQYSIKNLIKNSVEDYLFSELADLEKMCTVIGGCFYQERFRKKHYSYLVKEYYKLKHKDSPNN